jgi:hypothetical protein
VTHSPKKKKKKKSREQNLATCIFKKKTFCQKKGLKKLPFSPKKKKGNKMWPSLQSTP